jgi:putative ABC transport system permease protein
MIGVEDADRATEVAQAIDRTFANSLAETLTETEKAFQLGFASMTEAIMKAIEIVSYVVILIIMVVTANTMAMTARERIPEYATLKTIGFGPGFIAGVIVAESLLIVVAGGLAGMALTCPAAFWIEQELSQFFPLFSIAPETLVLDCLAALLVGVAAALFPAWRALSLSPAEGLRRIG